MTISDEFMNHDRQIFGCLVMVVIGSLGGLWLLFSEPGEPKGVSILEGSSNPVVFSYLDEFAEALSAATEDNHGDKFTEPLYSFPYHYSDLASPDCSHLLREKNLKDRAYWKLSMSSVSDTNAWKVVSVIREGDHGSGRAHSYAWSKDSKAAFIFGWGKPVGREVQNDMALIYMVTSGQLYAVDLKVKLEARTRELRRKGY